MWPPPACWRTGLTNLRSELGSSSSAAGLRKAMDVRVRLRSRLCENSCVGLARGSLFSITLNWKRTALAAIVERGKRRKPFCDNSARARFHTAWVKCDLIVRTQVRSTGGADECQERPVGY